MEQRGKISDFCFYFYIIVDIFQIFYIDKYIVEPVGYRLKNINRPASGNTLTFILSLQFLQRGEQQRDGIA